MKIQFANTRASFFGERHLFSPLTAQEVIAFVQGSHTHGDTCLLCGDTATADCASLSTKRCLWKGVWRVTPSTLRRISAELNMLNEIRYQRRLALALGVPTVGVTVEFLTDAAQGPVTLVAWKGGKQPPAHASFFRDLIPKALIETLRFHMESELLKAVTTVEHSLRGFPLPMPLLIDNPSVAVVAGNALGAWREFPLQGKSIEDWCNDLIAGGAPPALVEETDCESALTSSTASADVRRMAFQLLPLCPPAAVPVSTTI